VILFETVFKIYLALTKRIGQRFNSTTILFVLVQGVGFEP